MVRQVRSEVTRRKILDATIDVVSEVGYAAAGWGTIVERTGMTKGALYHHFDSKEALASEIIDEGADILVGSMREVCSSAAPALENMIRGTFAIVRVLGSDRTARAAEQLISALGGFNDAAARCCARWVAELAEQARAAIAEGDLGQGVDPEVLSESIVGSMVGTPLLSRLLGRGRPGEGSPEESARRLTQLWMFLLPGIAAEASLPYLRQFLARETLRVTRTGVSTITH